MKDGDTVVVHGVTYVADENAPRGSRMYVDMSLRPIRCGDVVVESGPVCIVSPDDLRVIAWRARVAERAADGTCELVVRALVAAAVLNWCVWRAEWLAVVRPGGPRAGRYTPQSPAADGWWFGAPPAD